MTTLLITTPRPELFLQKRGGGSSGSKSKKGSAKGKPREAGSAKGKWKYLKKKVMGKRTYGNEDAQTMFTNEARSVQQDGKSYLVVPGVPVREQVMNTYLLPASEIHPEDWNGTPLSIRHAQKNNGSVQVDNPDVPIIGYLANASWDSSKNRMLADYYIDETEAMRYPEGQVILGSIKNGQMLETSTAYWADEQYVSGVFNGKSYSTIHRNPKRDHIAIFPDSQLGACSIQDGCGVNRNMNHNCSQCMAQNVTGNLPSVGKALWEKVYGDNKGKGKESAAKMAWAACKKAGWSKDDEGEWVKQNNASYPEYKKNHLPTSMLIGYAMNKGSRTKEEMERARKYVAENGITKPVWVMCNGSYKILDGNHRVHLANELGIEQVPVRVVNGNLMELDAEAVYRKWLHEQDQGYLE